LKLKRRWQLFLLWFHKKAFPIRKAFWGYVYFVGLWMQTRALNFMVKFNVPMPPGNLITEDRYYRPGWDRYGE